MPVSEEVAARQLVRLKRLRKFPDDDEGQEDLLRVLKRDAMTPEHAARIVDDLLDRLQFAPVPAEIKAAAESVSPTAPVARNHKCPACRGTGYSQAWQLVTSERRENGARYTSIEVVRDEQVAEELKRSVDWKDQFVYDCAEPCLTCAYGRNIAASVAPAEEQRGKPEPLGATVLQFCRNLEQEL